MTIPGEGMPPVHINPEPGSPVHPQPTQGRKRPEAVRYFIITLVAVIGFEFIHQALTVAITLLDPSALKDAAKKSSRGVEGITEGQLTAVAYASVAVAALFSLLVIAVLTAAIRAVAEQKSWAANARGLLMVFSAFFAIRMITVFLVTAADSGAPTAVIAADGIAQILTGVAAVCALIFTNRDDVKKWTAKPKNPGNGATRPDGHHNDVSNTP